MNEIFFIIAHRSAGVCLPVIPGGNNCALCRLMRGRACQIGHSSSRKGTIAVIPLLLSRIENGEYACFTGVE